MSELTPDQQATVKQWVNEGKGLSEIQAGIKEMFDISLTYMDVRFLVDDIGAELKDAPSPGPTQPDLEDGNTPPPILGEDEAIEPEIDGGPGSAGGSVRVTVDKIQRPGAVIGGDVTFSDGVTAQWQIDQMGRLGLIPPREGYQPPEEDLVEFQNELQAVIQKQGF